MITDTKVGGGSYIVSARAAYSSASTARALLGTSAQADDLWQKAGVSPSRPSAGLAAFVTISDDAKAIKTIKDMAKSDVFKNAAQGITDERVRGLVRDGKIPTLPTLTDEQRKHLSKEEDAVYAVVSGLQGMYDAQPKSLQDALDQHVKSVLDQWPDMIAREKADVGSGKLPNTKEWQDTIARHEDELAAAQQGRMKIQAVNDPSLVRGVEDYTMRRDGEGWVGNGQTTVVSDPKSLTAYAKTEKWISGSSPYTSPYVITW